MDKYVVLKNTKPFNAHRRVAEEVLMETVISAAVIRDRKLLIVGERDIYTLPGGKLETGESDEECLAREIKEELSGSRAISFQLYKMFEGISPRRKVPIEVKVYFTEIEGIVGAPSEEVEHAEWAKYPLSYNLSDVTANIVRSLIEDGHLGRPGAP